eukprot:6554733-Prymnesium_polylepis.1
MSTRTAGGSCRVFLGMGGSRPAPGDGILSGGSWARRGGCVGLQLSMPPLAVLGGVVATRADVGDSGDGLS